MIQLYATNHYFFYKEDQSIYLYGTLGSSKVILNYINNLIFYVISNTFFLKKKKNYQFFFFKTVNKFYLLISSLFTVLFAGTMLKFGPKGKRVRVSYNNLLFFLKLGYSKRVPYFLAMDIVSYAKHKKSLFYNICGINKNSISKSLSHIISFRLIDPYNFSGLMLKDGIFKYNNWSRTLK